MRLLDKFNHHRTLFISVILILVAIVVFVLCLFLYFSSNVSVTKNVTLVFSYSENSGELVVDNSMPITDSVGKQLDFSIDQTKYGYSEFSIFANMEGLKFIDYEIYAIPVGVALELPTSYVKVYLTDGENDLPVDGYRKLVPTYSELKVAQSDPAGKKIYSGTLKKDEIKKFRLRTWLADTYPITTDMRSFKMLLYIKVID